MKKTLPHIIAVYNCNALGHETRVYDKIYGVNGYDLYADYSKQNESDYLRTEILSLSEFKRIDKDKYYVIDKGELGTIYEYKANKMLIHQIATKELSLLESLANLDNKESLTEKEQKVYNKYSIGGISIIDTINKKKEYVKNCVRLSKDKTYYKV